MTYPDVIALLHSYLTNPPVSLAATVASEVPDPIPDLLLQIRRIGGTQLRPVRDRARVDVIAWALTPVAAMTLALEARRLVHALAGTATLGPVTYRVDEFLGPRQDTDEKTGRPRVMATYTLTIRADDAIAR